MLRAQLQAMVTTIGAEVYFPAMEYCTDNGAMIAYAGWLHLMRGEHDSSWAIDVYARWPLFT